MSELSKEILKQFNEKVKNSVSKIGTDKLKENLQSLEAETTQPDFWSNPEKAKSVMSQISQIKNVVEESEKLLSSSQTLLELADTLTEAELDSLYTEYTDIQTKFTIFEQYQFLSCKYDKNNAIMTIHAGQGGTEANDWVAMLLRMYMRYCEKKGWKTSIEHVILGNETGYSTVTISIEGLYAYGLLKNEKGTHRLIRLSPFNASNLRQTTFAGVEVIPMLENEDTDINIPDSDIEFKAVRADGPGGQHVNKTSSAVQIRHIPTGIMVSCSEQRSQSQNRENAMRMLRAKLWQIEEEKRNKEMDEIKGEYKVATWSNQIRNYVLHPYKLVKDLRTGVENSNPDDILNGELDIFIDAELRLNYTKRV